jgi:hypothetical protein
MTQNETMGDELPSLALAPTLHTQSVTIPNAPAVRLQTLDLARHVAIAPNGKRYVVATFDDFLVGNGLVTTVYPQQNDYLTLVRLVVCSFSSGTEEEAIQRHIAVVEAIQQGKLNDIVQQAQQASQG